MPSFVSLYCETLLSGLYCVFFSVGWLRVFQGIILQQNRCSIQVIRNMLLGFGKFPVLGVCMVLKEPL